MGITQITINIEIGDDGELNYIDVDSKLPQEAIITVFNSIIAGYAMGGYCAEHSMEREHSRCKQMETAKNKRKSSLGSNTKTKDQ